MSCVPRPSVVVAMDTKGLLPALLLFDEASVSRQFFHQVCSSHGAAVGFIEEMDEPPAS